MGQSLSRGKACARGRPYDYPQLRAADFAGAETQTPVGRLASRPQTNLKNSRVSRWR